MLLTDSETTGIHGRNLATEYLIGNKPDRQAVNRIYLPPSCGKEYIGAGNEYRKN
jgi:hypothetical protein